MQNVGKQFGQLDAGLHEWAVLIIGPLTTVLQHYLRVLVGVGVGKV